MGAVGKSDASERRYELDWLRVILFGILVIYHGALGFGPHAAEVYAFENDQTGGPVLELSLYFSNTWRLPALFLISGIGTYFATSRGPSMSFMGKRIVRLMVPVIFGTFVLNLVAGYAMHHAMGHEVSWPYMIARWVFSPDRYQVMHLWFLTNLTVYTVICWPLFTCRERLETMRVSPVALVLGAVVAVTVIAVIFKPLARGGQGEGYQFAWYWGLFVAGYVFGTQHRAILDWTARSWRQLLVAGIISFAVELVLIAQIDARGDGFGALAHNGGWAAQGAMPAYGPLTLAFTVFEGFNAWFFSLAAMGLCARYLNQPSPRLVQLSQAVFPVYVLHYPVTVVALAVAASLAWPWQVEMIVVIFVVYVVTWALYLAAKNTPFPVFLIGGRIAAAPRAKTGNARERTA